MLMDRQTDKQTDGITPISRAMMVIYLPVKFEFDSTNGPKQTNKHSELNQFRTEPSYDGDLCPCQVFYSIGQSIFKLESGSENVDVRNINLIGGLVTCNPPKNLNKRRVPVNEHCVS